MRFKSMVYRFFLYGSASETTASPELHMRRIISAVVESTPVLLRRRSGEHRVALHLFAP